MAVSDNTNAVNIVGDLLDVAVFAGPLNTTQAAQWHSYGKRIFSYANPQVGVENPEIYRKNYGFALWNAGYDGAMNYAYQHGYGPSIWNDYDSACTHITVIMYLPILRVTVSSTQSNGRGGEKVLTTRGIWLL